MYNAKKIGGYEYVHRSQLSALPVWVRSLVALAEYNLPTQTYDIIKFNPRDRQKISLIKVRGFNTDAEPVAVYSLVYNTNGTFARRNLGLQVYHHKWQMVDLEYQGFDRKAAMERSDRILGWQYDRPISGNIENWRTICGDNFDTTSNSYLKAGD